jgi:ferredoxin/flavodoxin---NADP+ reductase
MNFETVNEYMRCKVVSNEMISETTAVLRLNRSFSFKAGQCINITVKNDIPPMIYSISSGEYDETIQILYKIVEEGKLTPLLGGLTANSYVHISRPFGKFLAPTKPAWLIATGTGIAPFLSMLLSGYADNKVLIHGNNSLSDFYFSELLVNLLGKNYIRCYTGNEECNYIKGRVKFYIDSFVKLPIDIMYYLCGSAEMVVDIRDILIRKGVPFQNIHAEIYF